MLQELTVRNFAIIEELDISFAEGLNILTGETGAGKSIIVGALDMLLGSRASQDYIRTGADKATINAIFDIRGRERVKEKLLEMGISDEGEQLLLTREISRSGANRVRINGQLTTLALFREVSPMLIDIHGQHEHQSLFSTEEQRILLDELAIKQSSELITEVRRLFKEMQEKKIRLDKLEENEKDRSARLDLLTYQLDELEKTDLKINEEEELLARHVILSNAERLFIGTKSISTSLTGEEVATGILENLALMMKDLEEFQSLDNKLHEPFKMMTNAYYQLQEIGEELRLYADKIYFEEEELKKIDERLGEINRLKRKYGPLLEEVLNYQINIKKELETLKTSCQELKNLGQEIDKLEEKYIEKAKKLSEIRQNLALEFSKNLKEQLEDLAMPQVQFQVSFRNTLAEDGLLVDGKKIKAYSWGFDQLEFMISPNLGEELKPLHKIASGGEISRIMLAIKSIVAASDQVSTMVFDEIDSGIGGNTAHKVAQRLAHIGINRQVICITHLPQIASMADEHFYIDKEVSGGLTKSIVRPLKAEEKVKELVRMLGGEMSETGLFHAQEMIKRAKELKETLL